MEEDIKEVIIKYISGREEVLETSEALKFFAGKRSDMVKNIPYPVLLFKKDEPLLRIYRSGHGIVFETSEGLKKFESMEALKSEPNKYWETLYNFNVLDKGLYEGEV